MAGYKNNNKETNFNGFDKNPQNVNMKSKTDKTDFKTFLEDISMNSGVWFPAFKVSEEKRTIEGMKVDGYKVEIDDPFQFTVLRLLNIIKGQSDSNALEAIKLLWEQYDAEPSQFPDNKRFINDNNPN